MATGVLTGAGGAGGAVAVAAGGVGVGGGGSGTSARASRGAMIAFSTLAELHTGQVTSPRLACLS
jgi:hypothetical protein